MPRRAVLPHVGPATPDGGDQRQQNAASHCGEGIYDPRHDTGRARRAGQTLGQQHQLELILCVAAAQRRGLLDADEAKRAGKDSNNIAPGFEISGLGQLIDAGIQADRLIVFGD